MIDYAVKSRMNCTHLYENAAIKILPLFLHQWSESFFLYSKVSTHDPTQLLPREICCHYFVLVLVINTLRKCSSWCSRGGKKSGYWMWNEIFSQKEFELLSNICTYTIWIVYDQEMQQNGKNTINIHCCFIDHRYCQNVAICVIYIL